MLRPPLITFEHFALAEMYAVVGEHAYSFLRTGLARNSEFHIFADQNCTLDGLSARR